MLRSDFCVDLRKVNTVTIKDCYSLPRKDETIDDLNGLVRVTLTRHFDCFHY